MILTVTFNPAIDHTYTVEKDLAEDHIMRTDDSQFDAGGKGINVASYLNTLGKDTVATGLLGGFTGEFIQEKLDEQGISHDFAEAGTTRINTTVIGEKTEYKVNHSGPETDHQAVEMVIDRIQAREPEIVVISGSLPPGLDYSAVEKIGGSVDADIVVDLHGDVLGQLEGSYLLAKPNRKELSEATGTEIRTVEDCRKASKLLLDRGFDNVLASLGEDGAVLSTKEQTYFVEGLEYEVVDTTGAGDAMLASMLSGLQDGMDKKDALKQALAFSTLAVETSGTRPPDIERLEEYIREVEVRVI